MISQPTNIVLTQIVTGIRITWDDGDNPADLYEIWCSIDAAEYIKVTSVKAGIETYDHAVVGESIKYKIKGVTHPNKSNYIKGKFDFDDYTIEPFADENGTPLHICFQRNKLVFAVKSGYLMWSTDMGYTFTEVAFDYADQIVMSFIFANGNVLFATRNNRLWLGKNGLSTITEKFCLNADNTLYELHTPVNPLYPGIYFKELIADQPVFIDGVEMKIWGAYTLYPSLYGMNGANPTNVYYSIDSGETIKIAYKFGYSPYRDNGTADGSFSEGNYVGDPDNPNVCHHVHEVIFNPYTQKFYISTGEAGTLFEGTYDLVSDTWSWTLIATNAFYRICGWIFTETKVRILSDSAGAPSDAANRGVWEADIEDIADHTQYARIYDFNIGDTNNLAPSIVYGDIIIAGHINTDNMAATVSLDKGESWATYQDIPHIVNPSGERHLMNIFYPNSNGDFIITPWDFLREDGYLLQSYLIRFK